MAVPTREAVELWAKHCKVSKLSFGEHFGLELLGQGAFAYVWDAGFGKVIKISYKPNYDDGYIHFVKKYLLNPERNKNIHLPKVYDYYSIKTTDDKNFHFVVMEKLKEQPSTDRMKWGYEKIAATSKEMRGLLRELKKEPYKLDIHGANIMKRGRTFVLTDPLSFLKQPGDSW